MMLAGKKVLLKYPVLTDIDDLLIWENDKEVWEAGDNKEPYSREDMELFVMSGQSLEENMQARWMIFGREDKKAKGCIDLYEYNAFNRRAGVGILIYSKEDRKKGFAKEALELLISFAKNDLKMHQLYCYILENNEASIELFKNCGFEKTGEKKEWRLRQNTWKNEFTFQLILD